MPRVYQLQPIRCTRCAAEGHLALAFFTCGGRWVPPSAAPLSHLCYRCQLDDAGPRCRELLARLWRSYWQAAGRIDVPLPAELVNVLHAGRRSSPADPLDLY